MDVDVDVVVAGAGPVGLTAAVELARRGVRARVVEQLAAPRGYAKAVGLQPRTLEHWERSGMLTAVLDEVRTLRGNIVYRDGVQAARLEVALPPDVPYGFTALPQYTTERLLAEELRRHGGSVERSTELIGFEQDADGVTVRLRTPAGEETVRTSYLVGADGAHSVVRKGLGLSFEGDAFGEEYMLGDVVLSWAMPAGYGVRITRTQPDGPDDVLVAIPLPGAGRYRITMLAPPELSTRAAAGGVAHGFEGGRAPELHHLQTVVDRLAPQSTTVSDLRWSSVFRISHRIVDRYADGRVFVAGDAAHIHPPTGGQGMNTGIQDAINLAWKLALVVDGVASPALLESYDLERRPVGEEVVGRTTRQARTGFETSDPAAMLRREAQLLVSYPDSPVVGAAGGSLGVAPGDRAPDARGLRRPAVTDPIRLHAVLAATEHALLVYVDDVAQIAEVNAARVHAATVPLPMRVHVVVGPDLGPVLADAGEPCLVDSAGDLAAVYGMRGGDAVLVRPDGYVGWTARPLATAEFASYLESLVGSGSQVPQ
ncbi:2-polyprenyl-6-methoxyphenol hydroxylase-like FAD-dependent oxidoreductase [Actinomycetospora succinea]|uniref:2-polyprenyl-6-methoxyphenol hydroxylase-like FAD-dependent oxidoreductase n=1 Tax=Actinomycetospora succinea TaxID=663603 RepID=A0A4R6VKR5_9PSEU|nr:FAD-dependent monooxygenase [Actinomycetospora succinea]TDQ62439.1 2-polyprenyl-6-methoxyphenol hydroxylase-like FAD-dependent oxidoreductase [Actinomycetospora succinea]